MSEDDRRQFPRLELSDRRTARGHGRRGHGHGRAEAGGGGFLIYPATPEAIKKLTVGNRLRITVKEPGSQAASTIDVEVRYRKGEALGVQFAKSQKGT